MTKHCHIEIPQADLEEVLDLYWDYHDAPLLNCYFSSEAYPMATREERELALIRVRVAWTTALEDRRRCGERRVKPTLARFYIMRQEYYARSIMNEVDSLPVATMPWNPHWPTWGSLR